MANLTWKNLVGQSRVKETLKSAFDSNALGHAYLFTGPKGVGKFQAAIELGMALLCRSDEQVPCYSCESCRQVLAHAHPDFHCVFPVALDKTHRSSDGKLSEDGWRHLADTAAYRIGHPYEIEDSPAIPSIPVEWIRETNHAIGRGAIRGSWNVALLEGIDTMNKESSNAMLKTLEEPPPGTMMLLCTDRPHALLPTIVSRCQAIRFGHIGNDDMRGALRRLAGVGTDDGRVENAVQCADGALGKALQLVQQPQDALLADAALLLQLCGEEQWLRVADSLEELVRERLGGGRDYGTAERVCTYAMYLVRDAFLSSTAGAGNYFPQSAPIGIPRDPERVEAIVQSLQRAASGVRARGNMLLVLATCISEIKDSIYE